MSHLTKTDHFINKPTQQHENNGNIRTIFSFLKKKHNNKNKNSTFTKGRMVRYARKDTKKYQKDKPDIDKGQFDNKTKTKEILLSLRYINLVFKIYMYRTSSVNFVPNRCK